MTRTPISFDDLDQDPNASSVASQIASEVDRAEAIRASAHIVNGGDEQFPCPACKGRGRFISYSGRDVGPCFKCKGTKTVSKGVVAAAKGKATKEANRIAFNEAHRAEREYLLDRSIKGFRIAGDMLRKWDEYGTLTEGQVAFTRKLMAEDAAKSEARKAQREQDAPVVDLTAIDALFAKATENAIKRPIFRTETLTLKKAASTGRNPGALYVTDTTTDAYLGKLVGGKFFASRDANADTAATLQAIAVDPTSEAIKYGRKFGRCGCCGKSLINPVSILAAVGPICAGKWGLDWKRDLAETEYAEMKAEELAKIKE
jgi:hypothetical protein